VDKEDHRDRVYPQIVRRGSGARSVVNIFEKAHMGIVSPSSFTIERKNECSCVVSILVFLHFLPEKSGIEGACRGLRIERLE
jgi:hypothetical protein